MSTYETINETDNGMINVPVVSDLICMDSTFTLSWRSAELGYSESWTKQVQQQLS